MKKFILSFFVLIFLFVCCGEKKDSGKQKQVKVESENKIKGKTGEKKQAVKIVKAGEVVDDFRLKDKDGKFVKLSDFKQRAVVLLFCQPTYENCEKGECCIDELERVKEFTSKLKNESLSVIVITRGKDEEERNAVRNIFKENNFKFHLLFDSDLKIARYFWAVPQPALYLIDKNRILRTPTAKSIEEKYRAMDKNIEGKYRFGKFKNLIMDVLENKIISELEFLPKIVYDKLPPIKLSDINGKRYSLSDYIGKKILIITLWGPTCPFCLKEIPLLQAYYLKNKDKKNIEIFGITRAEDVEVKNLIRQRILENAITYPNLIDETGEVGRALNIKTVPTMLFVDKKGIVKDILRSYREDTEQAIEKILEKL